MAAASRIAAAARVGGKVVLDIEETGSGAATTTLAFSA